MLDMVHGGEESLVEVEVSRLRPGMFVRLDLSWMDHPFSRNSFRIRDDADLQVLRELGLRTLRYCPRRSEVEPLALAQPDRERPFGQEAGKADGKLAEAIESKRQRREVLLAYREMAADARRLLLSASKTTRTLHAELLARPAASLSAANELVGDLAQRIPAAADTVLYAVDDRGPGAGVYNHSVNVAVLAMLLASKLELPDAARLQIGLGSLFHDFGMSEVPALIRNKADKLTAAERAILEDHCAIGERLVSEAGLSAAASEIVRQHHELIDGSGYPGRLTGERISPLAKVVAIVELYEQLCNPPNAAHSMTPHEAVSQLFVRYRGRLEEKALQSFIQMLGVYPPGSIVALSNDCFGKVLSVHPDRPLQPVLLLHDPESPGEEQMLVDLAQTPEIQVVRAIRPGVLSREAFAGLTPHLRAVYYFGAPLPRP